MGTGTAFPYATFYSGANQQNPTLLNPNTGLTFPGTKPTLKVGKSKPVRLSIASPTFQLASAGTATTGRLLTSDDNRNRVIP
jgi:hypothetical protein